MSRHANRFALPMFVLLSLAMIVAGARADFGASQGAGSTVLGVGGAQEYDAQLVDVAAVTPTDNAVLIGNGTNLVLESGATLKTSLGLTIGTNVQAWDTQLDSAAALAYTGNTLKVVRVNAGETAFELAAAATGDIEGVTAGTGMTGGGTSGTVTVNVADGLDDIAAITTAAQGGLLVHAGSEFQMLAAGTNAHVLTADSTSALGVKWAAASGGYTNGTIADVSTADYISVADTSLWAMGGMRTPGLVLGAPTTSGSKLILDAAGNMRVVEGDESGSGHLNIGYLYASEIYSGTSDGTNSGSHMYANGGLAVRSGGGLYWSSSATDANGALDLGLNRAGAGIMKVTDGSTGYGRIAVADGSEASPAYQGSGTSADSGIAFFNDTVYLVAAAVQRAYVSTTEFNVGLPFRVGGGSAAVPGAAFGSDTDTGAWNPASNQYAISAGGLTRKVYGGTVTLVDGSAVTVATIALASGARVSGRIDYGIAVTDGTDHQTMQNVVLFSAVDKAGTLTAGAPVEGAAATRSSALSSGTIDVDFTDEWTVVDGANLINIRCTMNTALTPTVQTIYVEVTLFGAAATVTIP